MPSGLVAAGGEQWRRTVHIWERDGYRPVQQGGELRGRKESESVRSQLYMFADTLLGGVHSFKIILPLVMSERAQPLCVSVCVCIFPCVKILSDARHFKTAQCVSLCLKC